MNSLVVSSVSDMLTDLREAGGSPGYRHGGRGTCRHSGSVQELGQTPDPRFQLVDCPVPIVLGVFPFVGSLPLSSCKGSWCYNRQPNTREYSFSKMLHESLRRNIASQIGWSLSLTTSKIPTEDYKVLQIQLCPGFSGSK